MSDEIEEDPCEWNPDSHRLGYPEEESHARAEVVIGNGLYRLCESCSTLHRFRYYKRTVIKNKEV